LSHHEKGENDELGSGVTLLEEQRQKAFGI